MPTAYTAIIGERSDVTFKEFALRCARNFGALQHMREVSLDAKLPEQIAASPYHGKALAEAERELAQLEALSDEQLQQRAEADYAQQSERYIRNVSKSLQLAQRYDAMTHQVQHWTPPTQEHVGLKDFMLEQLASSRKFDCIADHYTEPQRKSPGLWLAEQRERVERSVKNRREDYIRELERVRKGDAWLRQLRNSLDGVHTAGNRHPTFGDISAQTAQYVASRIVDRARPFICLEPFGQTKALKDPAAKTVTWRKYSSLREAPATMIAGAVPDTSILIATDATALLSQHGSIISANDVIKDSPQDPILNEAIAVLGEKAAHLIERQRVGALMGGTNVVYANGWRRRAVNTPFTLAGQNKVVKALKRQNAVPFKQTVPNTFALGDVGAIEAYIAVIHPDMEPTVRNMVDANGCACFIPAERYKALVPYPNEIGMTKDVRYVVSPLVKPMADVGGAKGGMMSTSGQHADVYPVLFLGRNAFGTVPFDGPSAITPFVVNEPSEYRSRIGWKAMGGTTILSDQFICRGEFAVAELN